jgi:hypothetical protein
VRDWNRLGGAVGTVGDGSEEAQEVAHSACAREGLGERVEVGEGRLRVKEDDVCGCHASRRRDEGDRQIIYLGVLGVGLVLRRRFVATSDFLDLGSCGFRSHADDTPR